MVSCDDEDHDAVVVGHDEPQVLAQEEQCLVHGGFFHEQSQEQFAFQGVCVRVRLTCAMRFRLKCKMCKYLFLPDAVASVSYTSYLSATAAAATAAATAAASSPTSINTDVANNSSSSLNPFDQHQSQHQLSSNMPDLVPVHSGIEQHEQLQQEPRLADLSRQESSHSDSSGNRKRKSNQLDVKDEVKGKKKDEDDEDDEDDETNGIRKVIKEDPKDTGEAEAVIKLAHTLNMHTSRGITVTPHFLCLNPVQFRSPHEACVQLRGHDRHGHPEQQGGQAEALPNL